MAPQTILLRTATVSQHSLPGPAYSASLYSSSSITLHSFFIHFKLCFCPLELKFLKGTEQLGLLVLATTKKSTWSRIKACLNKELFQ